MSPHQKYYDYVSKRKATKKARRKVSEAEKLRKRMEYTPKGKDVTHLLNETSRVESDYVLFDNNVYSLISQKQDIIKISKEKYKLNILNEEEYLNSLPKAKINGTLRVSKRTRRSSKFKR
jgi:hypothetical protein